MLQSIAIQVILLEPERAEAEQALEMAEAFVDFVIGVLPITLA